MADDLLWMEIATYTIDGIWVDGWCANEFYGEQLIKGITPSYRIESPIKSPFPVTQMFGENPAIYSRFNLAGHNGIDFGTPVGTPIYNVREGTATHVRIDQVGYGKYIRIDSPSSGIIAIYAHLEQQHVNEGAYIEKGAMIGLSGNTGGSTGAHLHFEVRIPPINDANGFGGRVDPIPFVDDLSNWIFPDYLPEKLRNSIF